MARTLEQESALNEYASAVGQHVLRAMEARENTDVGFKQALEESFQRLDACRKRLKELGIIPLF
jgi:hypothetical protein